MRSLPLYLLLLLSTGSALAQMPLEGTSITDRADLPHASGFVSRADSADHLLNAIGVRARQPLVISPKAQKKKVSGNFDLARPFDVLAKVTAELGLIWYSDSTSIYVYDASEQKNAVGRLRSASVATLSDFLRKARLADARYPVRGGGADGTFYVAGPPVYVDIVLNAARYLDDLYEGADASPHHVEVIKLEHSFVNSRRYGLRSTELDLPGVADVLARVLSLGDFGAVVKAPPAPLPTGAITETVPGAAPTLPAPPDVGTMPAGPAPAVVVPYTETNSLIVRGTLAQIEQVRRLIGELDTPRKQIELSLWIIDIKKTELDRLGVNWSGGINVGKHLSIGLNQTSSSSTLDGTRFLASVQALSSKGNAHIISRPVLLTQENVPAYFDSNQTFYAQLLGERATSLEAVTYGTLVSVRPRISSGNEVEMQLKIEDGAADGNRPVDDLPRVNRTVIDTVARVPEQYSLLIGGYSRSQSESGDNGIPGLRRIPGVGKLFGQDTHSAENMVRVFLIQPRLLASNEPADSISMPEVYGAGIGDPLRESIRALHPEFNDGEGAHGRSGH